MFIDFENKISPNLKKLSSIWKKFTHLRKKKETKKKRKTLTKNIALFQCYILSLKKRS